MLTFQSMKILNVYVAHPTVKDISSFIECFHFEDLTNKYEFRWDVDSPDYLFATEHIYRDKECFTRFKKYYNKSKIRIFSGGEAVYCDWNIFDYGTGFDGDTQIGNRFIQFPSPNNLFDSFIFKKENSIKNIEEAYQILKTKNKFCNFLYSNPNAHPMRDKLFYNLSEYKRVDSLGKHLNNVNTKGTGYLGHHKDCVTLKEPYKFSIACENASFPGYTSEKIFTSFQAHTIPIYFGNPLIKKDINEKAIINCNDYTSVDEVISKIKEIDNSDELWCEMISQPWQTKEQEENMINRDKQYLKFFDNLFSKDIKDCKVLPEGTFNDLPKMVFR